MGCRYHISPDTRYTYRGVVKPTSQLLRAVLALARGIGKCIYVFSFLLRTSWNFRFSTLVAVKDIKETWGKKRWIMCLTLLCDSTFMAEMTSDSAEFVCCFDQRLFESSMTQHMWAKSNVSCSSFLLISFQKEFAAPPPLLFRKLSNPDLSPAATAATKSKLHRQLSQDESRARRSSMAMTGIEHVYTPAYLKTGQNPLTKMSM